MASCALKQNEGKKVALSCNKYQFLLCEIYCRTLIHKIINVKQFHKELLKTKQKERHCLLNSNIIFPCITIKIQYAVTVIICINKCDDKNVV